MEPVTTTMADGNTTTTVPAISPELQRAQDGGKRHGLYIIISTHFTFSVQRQIPKMLRTLDLTETGQGAERDAARQCIRVAYGQHGVDDIDTLRGRIRNLNTDIHGNDQVVKISNKTPQQVDTSWRTQINAVTNFAPTTRDSINQPITSTGPVELGTGWNKGDPAHDTQADLDRYDTATIMHESGHYFNHALDDYVNVYRPRAREGPWEMVPLGMSLDTNDNPRDFGRGADLVQGGGCT